MAPIKNATDESNETKKDAEQQHPAPEKSDSAKQTIRSQQDSVVTVKILNSCLDKRFSKQKEDLSLLIANKIAEALKNITVKIETNTKNIASNTAKLQSLSKQSDQDRTTVNSLSECVAEIENRVTACSSLSTVNEVFCEMRKRDKRVYNFILFGFPDNDNEKMDLAELAKLFAKLNLDVKVRKASRIGKIVENKIRPLKLIFATKNMAQTVLKNRKLFKDAKLGIDNDKTPREKGYLELLRSQLQSRLSKGETDLTIKYVKGAPLIVSKNAQTGSTRQDSTIQDEI